MAAADRGLGGRLPLRGLGGLLPLLLMGLGGLLPLLPCAGEPGLTKVRLLVPGLVVLAGLGGRQDRGLPARPLGLEGR